MAGLAMNRTPLWLAFLGVLLMLPAACTEPTAVDWNVTPESAPSLQPASTLLARIQATQTPSSSLVAGSSEISPAETSNTPEAFSMDDPPKAMPPLSYPQLESTAAVSAGEAIPTLVVPTEPVRELSFNQAQIFEEGPRDCEAEINDYQEYLTSDPYIATYKAPIIAACYLDRGDRPAAVAVYEAAIESGPDRITEVLFRQNLASLFVEDGNYPAAIAQYDAILEVAQTEKTRSQAIYQAGQTELLAGNRDAGFARYLALMTEYPAVSESYQALTELVDAGYPVEPFQSGLVAFHAEVYDSAIEAFNRYTETNPEHREDVHLYLAWSFEGLEDLEEALSQIDAYIEANRSPTGRAAGGTTSTGDPLEAAHGWIERAKMQVRAGRLQAAIDDYLAYMALFPQGEQAPFAAWQSAALAEELGDLATAVERYLAFTEKYPDHEDAAEALFRVGYLSWRAGKLDDALLIWQQAIDAYPEQEFGAASLLWLLINTSAGEAAPFVELAINNTGQSYYAIRARHLATGLTPFAPAGEANLFLGETGREFAEAWLREWLGLGARVEVAALSEALAMDSRLIGGEKLWRLGLREEARREFESLRAEYAHDALASYQLALYFRDLGLYRSSIVAATSLMSLAELNVSEAPRFIARLAYPVYYADLVLAESSFYGYDPLLQFALIREESLFENFATSAAGAQGLSQLLPETGASVAQQLNRPDYKTGDLYRPAVGIAFGAYYLDQQLDTFGGNVAAALAAYNAGPGHAARWYGRGSEDFDTFLETVDFAETQRYLKQIYIAHNIYRFLYS